MKNSTDPEGGRRLAGMARDGIIVREAVTHGGRARWPLSELGSAILGGIAMGIALLGMMFVLRAFWE
uniref:Uncharacterized protein n=1 Tax=viral metagenome TaxID=1070528 RepID=A0A6M3LGS6_9ZZZZ